MSRGGSTSLHVNVYIPPLPSRRSRRRSWREKARRSSRARATSPTRRRPRWRSRAQAGEKEVQFDAVGVETERYKFLAPEEVQPYVRNDGLLNEFKMAYAFRHRFPLPAALHRLQADGQPPPAQGQSGAGLVLTRRAARRPQPRPQLPWHDGHGGDEQEEFQAAAQVHEGAVLPQVPLWRRRRPVAGRPMSYRWSEQGNATL